MCLQYFVELFIYKWIFLSAASAHFHTKVYLLFILNLYWLRSRSMSRPANGCASMSAVCDWGRGAKDGILQWAGENVFSTHTYIHRVLNGNWWFCIWQR